MRKSNTSGKKIGEDSKKIGIKKQYYNDPEGVCRYNPRKPRPRERKMKKDLFLNNPCTQSGDWCDFLNLHWN